ncbi:MAG TPA: hypothetical protein PK573_07100 [Spirochaetota bacterium]|nr:hypothetical protein [Spirochaetota bacterium]HRZ25292.1 hypothetical protein [Spirochaetota bacterium]
MIVFAFVSGCKNEQGIFQEYDTKRLKVVLKGTFASNSPAESFIDLSSITSENVRIKDDSIVLCNESLIPDDPGTPEDESALALTELPSRYMLDIAEMELNHDNFSKHRKARIFSMVETEAFFDGTGISLDCDDPVHLKAYSNVRLKTRKMAFDKAKIYNVTADGWAYKEDAEIIFNEKDGVKAYNVNLLQKNSYYDSLREESSHINKVYPLKIPIVGGMTFNRNKEEMVLEVRILVKNFIKKYEYKDYDSEDDDELVAIHFYGFSDWLRDVGAGEYDIGGNIIGVARTYVPSSVGSISGTTPARNMFVIAVPAGDPITNYALVRPQDDPEFPATPPVPYTGSGPVTDLTDGNYQIVTPEDHSEIFAAGDYIEVNPWGTNTATKQYFVKEVTATAITFMAKSGYGDSALDVDYSLLPASYRDNNPCDLPKAPDRDEYLDNIYSYLDYLASYEEYRYEWNAAIQDCNDLELLAALDADWSAFNNYAKAWVNYENSVKKIVLPPLAAYAASVAGYTIENVMPGSYDIYYTNIDDVSDIERYGKLFYADELDAYSANPVTVGKNESVTLNIP